MSCFKTKSAKKHPNKSTYIVTNTVTATRLGVERYPDTASLETAENDVGLRLEVGGVRRQRWGISNRRWRSRDPVIPPIEPPGHESFTAPLRHCCSGIVRKVDDERVRPAKSVSTTTSVEKEIRTIYDMVAHLSGRTLPCVNPDCPLPPDPTQRVLQIYTQHHTLLAFIRFVLALNSQWLELTCETSHLAFSFNTLHNVCQ